MKTVLIFTLAGLLGSGTLPARTWTSADGRSLEADFVKATAADVTLRRSRDKQEFTLALDQLSEADRAFVAKQAASATAAGNKPVEAKGLFANQVTGDWAKLEFASLKFRFYGGKDLDAAKRYPLVIFLHGKTRGGTDNEKHLDGNGKSFAKPENYATRPCFVLVPQCPNDEIGWNGEYQADLIKLIESAKKNLPVDADRIYLTGLSMGGFGTWSLLAKEPKLFAAAIPVCGGGDPGSARAMKKVAIWAFHGDADNIVKVDFSRRMVEALKREHGNITYTELPGVNHNA